MHAYSAKHVPFIVENCWFPSESCIVFVIIMCIVHTHSRGKKPARKEKKVYTQTFTRKNCENERNRNMRIS